MSKITTINELCSASSCFIVKLNYATKASLYHRYQIYVIGACGELKILNLSGKYKIKYQNKALCSFMPEKHFVLKGKDKENIEKITIELKKYNKDLKVNYLNGY